MAAGDAVSYVADLASGATVFFQPAAGVEVCLMSFSSERNDNYSSATSGTFITTFWYKGSTTDNFNINGHKMFINNSSYLRIGNFDASQGAFSYSGIQTK
tara:strand:- start:44 stop:343 length:300 start_codon:yes stop_codon:yes gene_type:complete